MSPLPGWSVVPAQWAEHHRPTAEASFTARIAFYHAGEPEPWPLPEGWTGQTAFHEADCRIQQLNREGVTAAAGQPTNLHDYLVVVPISTPTIQPGEGGDYGIVVSASDPLLVGRRLDVRDVQHGSLMWERDLICTDNQTQNRTA
jgi:hypothetical protein